MHLTIPSLNVCAATKWIALQCLTFHWFLFFGKRVCGANSQAIWRSIASWILTIKKKTFLFAYFLPRAKIHQMFHDYLNETSEIWVHISVLFWNTYDFVSKFGIFISLQSVSFFLLKNEHKNSLYIFLKNINRNITLSKFNKQIRINNKGQSRKFF